MKEDHYAALGVDRKADEPTIRRAYRKRSKKAHPDAGGSREEWDKVNKALMVLTNPKARDQYDRTGDTDAHEADDTDAEARSRAVGAVMTVISTIEQGRLGDVVEFDIIADAVTGQRKEEAKLKDKITSYKESVRKTKRVLERIKVKKGKTDLLTPALNKLIADAERMISLCEQDIVVIRRSIEYLKDHEFMRDSRSSGVGYETMPPLPGWLRY